MSEFKDKIPAAGGKIDFLYDPATGRIATQISGTGFFAMYIVAVSMDGRHLLESVVPAGPGICGGRTLRSGVRQGSPALRPLARQHVALIAASAPGEDLSAPLFLKNRRRRWRYTGRCGGAVAFSDIPFSSMQSPDHSAFNENLNRVLYTLQAPATKDFSQFEKAPAAGAFSFPRILVIE